MWLAKCLISKVIFNLFILHTSVAVGADDEC